MSMAERIERKLHEALSPASLRIADDSESHRGHGGYREGGETHFRVEIVAAAFDGQSRVQRQRRVYEILAEELEERVHALQLTTLTPDEAEARQS